MLTFKTIPEGGLIVERMEKYYTTKWSVLGRPLLATKCSVRRQFMGLILQWEAVLVPRFLSVGTIRGPVFFICPAQAQH